MLQKTSQNKKLFHPKILEYVDKLMKHSALNTLPAKQFSFYRQRFVLRAQAMVVLAMMKKITSEKEAAVNDFADKIVNKNLTASQFTHDKLTDFLRVVLPDFKQITDSALREFKQEFLTNFKK